MKAIVSGRACTALLIDGNALHSIHYDHADQLVFRSPEEFRLLFGGAEDLDFIDNIESIDDVRDRLADAVDCTEALDLFLYLCDDQLSAQTHESASAELEEFIVYPEIVASLEQVLFALPLPTSVDLQRGLTACDTTKSEHSRNFLRRVLDHQPAIATVRQAWEAIPSERFENIEGKQVEAICLRHGLFRDLAVELAESDCVVNSQMRWSTDVRLRRELPAVAGLLNEWSRLIDGSRSRRESIPQYLVEEHESRHLTRQQPRNQPRRSMDRGQVLDNVNSQKKRIVAAMRQSDLHRVRQLVEQLILYQRENGGVDFACRSLCDLAMEAQEFDLFELQNELTQRSVILKPDDCWSWTQHGKSLLNLGMLCDAIVGYDQAEDFSKLPEDNAVARNGRAEVLKAQGEFDAALAEYDAVCKDHPHNLRAQTGRAEVLKAQGHLDAALSEYDAVCNDDPQNVIARNGRAEVLKAKGDLIAALSEYDAICNDHPDDTSARNGRAEILKAQGDFVAALAEYDTICNDHPNDVFARNGRAEIFKAQGDLDTALAEYDAVCKDHPHNVITRTGRAEVLRAQGNLDAALSEYDTVCNDHPHNVIARNGRAGVLKAKGDLDAALAEYDAVCKDHPHNVVARTGRAEVLRAQGDLDAALVEYDTLRKDHPNNVIARTGRAEVLKAQGDLIAALAEYDAICNEHPHDLIARNGRAVVLSLLMRYDEALCDLPSMIPVNPNDWIGYHIRGMIYLRSRQTDEAIQIFETGVGNCPFPEHADFFRTALVTARFRQRRFADALTVLNRVTTRAAKLQANVLSVHAFGELQEFDAAKVAHDHWQVPRNESDAATFAELERRYIHRQPAAHDDGWLIESEIRFLQQSV